MTATVYVVSAILVTVARPLRIVALAPSPKARRV
jgi:hypothetical protein